MSTDALRRACEIAGGQTELAKKIGTAQQTVSNWLRLSKKGVPAEFVPKIEEVTGVPRSELRPDLWPVVEEARA